jgi:hypothetical protein
MSGINAVPRTNKTGLSTDDHKTPSRDEREEPRPQRPQTPAKASTRLVGVAVHKLNVQA